MSLMSRDLGLCRVLQRYQVTSPWPLVPVMSPLPPNRFPRVSSQSEASITEDWPIRGQQLESLASWGLLIITQISANQRTLITYQQPVTIWEWEIPLLIDNWSQISINWWVTSCHLTINTETLLLILIHKKVRGKICVCQFLELRKPGVTKLLMMGCNCEQIQNLQSARERDGILTPSRPRYRDIQTGSGSHSSCQQPEETRIETEANVSISAAFWGLLC